MENLTHTLVGILLSRAGLNHLTPRATAICVVAANLPDVDIVTAASPIDYLTYHRHITHALPAMPVMAALAVLLVEGVHRWRRQGGEAIRWGPAFAAALLATLSHVALDMTNAYGTRLWLPFDGRLSSWDVLFVVDLWVWVILLFPLFVAFGVRRLGGGSRTRWVAPLALTALGVLMAYVGFRTVLHEQVVAGLAGRMYDGHPAVRVAAFPIPTEVFRWSAFVETEHAHLIGIVDARNSNEEPKWQRFDKLRETAVLRKARAAPVARRYLDFASYVRTEIESTGDGYWVRFSDFRFRRGEAAGFLCTVELDHELNVTREEFQLWGGGGLFAFAQRVLRSLPAESARKP